MHIEDVVIETCISHVTIRARLFHPKIMRMRASVNAVCNPGTPFD